MRITLDTHDGIICGFFNIAKKRIYEIGGNYERLYN